jgi:hypothetical protein
VLVGSEEWVAEVLAHTGVSSQAPASKDHPVATQSGRVRSGEAEAGPSRSVLGGESGIDDKNGVEGGLPVKRVEDLLALS